MHFLDKLCSNGKAIHISGEIFIYSMNYRYWFNPNIGHCNENPLVENKLKYRENLKFTKKYFMISTPIKTCCILMCA